MSNYPDGVINDSTAPFNERENPNKAFTLSVSQTLQCDFRVHSNRYACCDGDIDYQNTDWEDVFNDEQHYTPLELMNEYRKLVIRFIEYVERHHNEDKNIRRYKIDAARLERELNGYTEIETIIEPIE